MKQTSRLVLLVSGVVAFVTYFLCQLIPEANESGLTLIIVLPVTVCAATCVIIVQSEPKWRRVLVGILLAFFASIAVLSFPGLQRSRAYSILQSVEVGVTFKHPPGDDLGAVFRWNWILLPKRFEAFLVPFRTIRIPKDFDYTTLNRIPPQRVEEIRVWNSNLTDEDCDALTRAFSAKKVDANWTAIGINGVRKLLKMEDLSELNVYETNLSRTDAEEIQEANPGIAILTTWSK